MPLRRISAQKHLSLHGFYQELAAAEATERLGKMMADLVEFLDANLKSTIWGLTSHYSLWLLARDDYRSPWLVEVFALPAEGYRIQYRIPESAAPWSDAFVQGMAKTKEQTLEYILVALDRAGTFDNLNENVISYAEIDQILVPWSKERELSPSHSFQHEEIRNFRLIDDHGDSYMLLVAPDHERKVRVSAREGPHSTAPTPFRHWTSQTELPKIGETLNTAYWVILGWMCERGHNRS
jgi:hypothetical protein